MFTGSGFRPACLALRSIAGRGSGLIHWNYSEKDTQLCSFSRQIDAAAEEPVKNILDFLPKRGNIIGK